MPRHLHFIKAATIFLRTNSIIPCRRDMSSEYLSVAKALDILPKYGACDISDALLKLKVAGAGFLPDLIPYCDPASQNISKPARPVVAPASTVLFIPKNDSGSAYPPSNIPAGEHWVDLTEASTIPILSQPEGQRNAVLGGIMALRMKERSALGVVVHGRIRDIHELKETQLPIWAKGTSTVGAGAESKPYAVNIPITISGITIIPGDLVFSDPANGVVIIPKSKVNELLELLPRIIGADDKVKEAVTNGMSVQQAFKEHRSGL